MEKYLLDRGVHARFSEDAELGKYIVDGVDSLLSKNIETPKNFLFLPAALSSIATFIGILGMTYWLKSPELRKESPIFFPRNIYKNTPEQGDMPYDYHSTPDRLHTFYHEAGHWLHIQNPELDEKKNEKTWKEDADINFISERVSKRAAAGKDGSELCAEYFAGTVFGWDYSDEIENLVRKLGFLY